MKKLLHIIATPRERESRTLKMSGAFLEVFGQKYPECEIDEINVTTEKLPDLTAQNVNGKYVLLGGKDLSGEFKELWKEIELQIERFLSADGYLISTPMWNFNIPYYLKHYIDIIVQPKYLFQYTEKGAEGLATGKKMVVITSRGGDYSPESPAASNDYQEPYLRAIFGLTGVTDITFVNAQPMDAMGPEVQIRQVQLSALQAVEAVDTF
ncbi:FMN-dependent NADH-azoreductase [Candidatus Omnitrophota bacterium]